MNNGQELYINRKHQRADQWVTRLRPGDADKAWEKSVRDRTGWDQQAVPQEFTALLTTLGYRKISDDKTPENIYLGSVEKF
jgi:hypothetical protein